MSTNGQNYPTPARVNWIRLEHISFFDRFTGHAPLARLADRNRERQRLRVTRVLAWNMRARVRELQSGGNLKFFLKFISDVTWNRVRQLNDFKFIHLNKFKIQMNEIVLETWFKFDLNSLKVKIKLWNLIPCETPRHPTLLPVPTAEMFCFNFWSWALTFELEMKFLSCCCCCRSIALWIWRHNLCKFLHLFFFCCVQCEK